MEKTLKRGRQSDDILCMRKLKLDPGDYIIYLYNNPMWFRANVILFGSNTIRDLILDAWIRPNRACFHYISSFVYMQYKKL